MPTSLSLGPDGYIYVGELHSEQPGKAKVWKYDRRGNPVRSWGGFTTVTGVARGKDGSLYVSELFGGPCTFDQIPACFPGRVVKVVAERGPQLPEGSVPGRHRRAQRPRERGGLLGVARDRLRGQPRLERCHLESLRPVDRSHAESGWA